MSLHLVLTPSSPTPSQETSASSMNNQRAAGLTKAYISQLWVSTMGLYSQLFVHKYGIEDSGIWFETLCNLTPKALEKGLDTLKRGRAIKYIDFPPNPMFKKAYEEVCHLVIVGIELPKVTVTFEPKSRHPEVALTHLSQLKKHLGVRA